jgi:hypothetical protein
VRTNVYDMLSALASAFSPEQLDMLFSKFGTSNQEQSLLDSTKRAQLLLNLAQSEANSEQVRSGEVGDKTGDAAEGRALCSILWGVSLWTMPWFLSACSLLAGFSH